MPSIRHRNLLRGTQPNEVSIGEVFRRSPECGIDLHTPNLSETRQRSRFYTLRTMRNELRRIRDPALPPYSGRPGPSAKSLASFCGVDRPLAGRAWSLRDLKTGGRPD